MPIESIPTFDLYAELGVSQLADRAAIEAAFRDMAKRHHPDTSAETATATDRMKRLNLARSWLIDPDRRARYDDVRGVRGGPDVELPNVDPLGAWPSARPGTRQPHEPALASNLLRNTIALVALMAFVALIAGGFGEFASITAAILGGVLLLYFALLAILGLLMPGRHDR